MSKSDLLDFVNTQTGNSFTLYNVDVGQPNVNGIYTEVILTGKPSGGYDGQITCQYQRTELASINFGEHVFTLPTGHDIREIIPQLNAVGWAVSADEFEPSAVSSLVDGKFPLTAKGSSYRYSGSVDIPLTLT